MKTRRELCQLYDKQGRPINGTGATKDDLYSKGLLHGASHVWVYCKSSKNDIEVLLQKRAATNRTWPNCYDISAAGHIDLGESPLTTAIRETREEIGYTPKEEELQFIGTQRQYITTSDNYIENEFCWLYLLELEKDINFKLQDSEVASLKWGSLNSIKQEVLATSTPNNYVPHSNNYFRTLFEAIERLEK